MRVNSAWAAVPAFERMVLLAVLVCAIFAVAACSPKPPPRVTVPVPPADKLVCPEEPAVPDDPITDATNAQYLKAMRAWGGACKADVDWLAIWFRSLNRK